MAADGETPGNEIGMVHDERKKSVSLFSRIRCRDFVLVLAIVDVTKRTFLAKLKTEEIIEIS